MSAQSESNSRTTTSYVEILERLKEWGMTVPRLEDDESVRCLDFLSRSYVPFDNAVPSELVDVPFSRIGMELTRRFLETQEPFDPNNACEAGVQARILHELTRQVCRLLEEPLLAMFNEFRRNSGQTTFLDNQRDYFERFERCLLEDSSDFFRSFPPLKSALHKLLSSFVSSIRKLMMRLNRDFSELQSHFGISGKVCSVDLGLSDPHNGQQSVAILTFSNGRRLVYKPRDVHSDQVLNNVVQFMASLLRVDMKTFAVLPKDEYGWCECVSAAPCLSVSEAREYAHRAGILLCTAHVLAMTDGHLENIIACGSHPVIVDGETIMTSRAKPMEWPETTYADTPSSRLIEESVVRTGFVPRWDIDDAAKVARDISGFGGRVGVSGRSRIPRIVSPNTDAMRIELIERDDVHDRVANLPTLHGAQLDLCDFVDDIIAGFSAAYDRISCFTSAESSRFMELLNNCTTRFVFRNTFVYFAIRNESQKARSLRSHDLRLSVILGLAKPFVECHQKPHSLGVLAEEINALRKGDIPYFVTRSDSTHLFRCDGTVVSQDFLEESGLELVRRRISSFSKSDLQLQSTVIRSAFAALRSGSSATVVTRVPVNANPVEHDGKLLRTGWIDHFQSLGMGILNSIHWVEAEIPCVISCKYVPSVSRFQIAPMGWCLYDGQLGIMLALASMERATSDSTYGNLLRSMFQQLADRVNRPVTRVTKSLVDEIGIGGYLGVGSILYGLSVIARKSYQYRDFCSSIVGTLLDSISEEHIKTDKTLDLMGGTAGLACAVVSCLDEFGTSRAKVLAAACAEKLVKSATDTPLGGKAWRGVEALPLSGLSHGASGIVLALAQLYRILGDDSLVKMADEGIRFENQLLNSDSTNWKDLRGKTDWSAAAKIQESQSSWCHGAPGILLSRLAWTQLSPEMFPWTPQLDHALHHLSHSHSDGPDHLCCGEMGRIHTLKRAAAILGETSYSNAASKRLEQLIERSVSRGGYRLLPGINDNMLHLGYFQGISGILHSIAEPIECGNALVLSLD